MTTRQDIAAAASSVDGVEISPLYNAATEPGGGWVERIRTEYDAGVSPAYGSRPFWRVTVVMPNDVQAAEQWMEDNQELLVTALWESGAMAVTSATPATLTLVDMPSMKVLQIDGFS